MPDSDRRREYQPLDDRTQTAWRIEGYPRTFTRTPDEPPVRRAPTLTELTGPIGLERRLTVGAADLSRPDPGSPRAIGQLIVLRGRVLDEEGVPTPGAVVEMWQANAAGKYIHEYDRNDAPADPNFIGSARVATDAQGRFAFTTVKPGAYPVPDSGRWWRPPHVHFSVIGASWMTRIVTQMFFPGDPLNAWDRLLQSIPDPAARERLVARAVPTADGPDHALVFEHDIVLRGRAATPELDD